MHDDTLKREGFQPPIPLLYPPPPNSPLREGEFNVLFTQRQFEAGAGITDAPEAYNGAIAGLFLLINTPAIIVIGSPCT